MQVTGTFPALSSGMKKPAKVKKVMHEFKHGSLHSGSKKGPKVKSRKQAIAIALSEAGESQPPMHGMGMVKRAPRKINAPKSLGGRRAASHLKHSRG